MKRPLRILALTDHKAHHSENSIYPLLKALADHPRTREVAVASRSVEKNHFFFYQQLPGAIEVQPVDQYFSFTGRDAFFSRVGQMKELGDFDLILFRLPRPIPEGFFRFAAEQFPNPGGIMINHPVGIERTSNKAFLLEVADLCPPVRLLENLDEIDSFRRIFPIVLKPLENFGGKGLVKIENDLVWEGNFQYTYEEFMARYRENPGPMLGMQYLRNVHQGDKRIIVIDGVVVAASLRLPAQDSWLCNVSQGGTAKSAVPDAEEWEIIRKLVPVLKEKGVLFFGLDTLVNDDGKRVLSEINTLSVGGLGPAEKLHKKPLVYRAAEIIVNAIGG